MTTTDPAPPDPATLIPSQRQRRQRIVQQAMRMLETGEYDQIQMRDVAAGADVALGTVYRYFRSKEHLFAAVLVEWSDSLRSRVERQPLLGADTAAQLCDLLLRVVEAFERLPQYFRLIMTLEATPDQHARALYDEFTSRTHDTFAEPLSTLDPDDAQAVLTVLMAVLGATMRGWARGSQTTAEMRASLTDSVRLIFSPAPAPRRKDPT